MWNNSNANIILNGDLRWYVTVNYTARRTNSPYTRLMKKKRFEITTQIAARLDLITREKKTIAYTVKSAV